MREFESRHNRQYLVPSATCDVRHKAFCAVNSVQGYLTLVLQAGALAVLHCNQVVSSNRNSGQLTCIAAKESNKAFSLQNCNMILITLRQEQFSTNKQSIEQADSCLDRQRKYRLTPLLLFQATSRIQAGSTPVLALRCRMQ